MPSLTLIAALMVAVAPASSLPNRSLDSMDAVLFFARLDRH